MVWQNRIAALLRYQRHMIAVLLGGVALLLVQSMWGPSVTAVAPAELEVREAVLSGISPTVDDRSLDFVFRPLFSASRRAAELAVAVEEAAVDAPAVKADMEGFVLLGVFASGASEGVILRRKDGGKQRLYLGDRVGEWTLDKIDPRAAEFSGPLGELGRLALALTTTLPPIPESIPRASIGESGQNADQQALVSERGKVDEVDEVKEARLAPVTFDAIWEQRRLDAEAAQRESSGPISGE